MQVFQYLVYVSKKALWKRKLAKQSLEHGDPSSTRLNMEVPPCDPKYHVWWTKVLFGVTIGMAFANIQLLTTIAAIYYVGVCYFVYSRQLLYFHTNDHESNGRNFWATASRWLLTLLFVSQLVLGVVHSLKESFASGAVTLFSCVLTVMIHRRFQKTFLPQLSVLPLLFSARADLEQQANPVSRMSEQEGTVADTYRSEEARTTESRLAEISAAEFSAPLSQAIQAAQEDIRAQEDRQARELRNEMLKKRFRAMYTQRELAQADFRV